MVNIVRTIWAILARWCALFRNRAILNHSHDSNMALFKRCPGQHRKTPENDKVSVIPTNI